MGLKPHDCAKVMGQKECAEFLLLYETSLEMAKELSEVHTKREVLMAEHNELRSYFKYVHRGWSLIIRTNLNIQISIVQKVYE